MSALGKNLLKKEDVIINVICLVLAAGIIALAVMNVSWDAGMAGLITTDNLFFIVVCLLQSPKFRAKVFGAKGPKGPRLDAAPVEPAPAADAAPKMEVSR